MLKLELRDLTRDIHEEEAGHIILKRKIAQLQENLGRITTFYERLLAEVLLRNKHSI